MDDIEKKVKLFLNMLWLRPENVVFDVIKAELIGKELLKSDNILEVGIGNGYFTFMAMGGEFKEEYDWYYNVGLDGFWNNKDIYDSIKVQHIKDFVKNPAEKRLKLAVDLKANLVEQAIQLGFIDKTIVMDANKEIEFENIDTVYSNMLYFLDNPFRVLKDLEKCLAKNSKIILAFPNSNFYENCKSYKRESKLMTLINRGRADYVLWSMDLRNFNNKLLKYTGFEIEKDRRYLSKLTLQTWDIGFRPFSPHLIKMANSLTREERFEIKQEWCETSKMFVDELMENELEKGNKEGGFNFVVLRQTK